MTWSIEYMHFVVIFFLFSCLSEIVSHSCEAAVEEGAIGSDKEALDNLKGCESGMNVYGLLLC